MKLREDGFQNSPNQPGLSLARQYIADKIDGAHDLSKSLAESFAGKIGALVESKDDNPLKGVLSSAIGFAKRNKFIDPFNLRIQPALAGDTEQDMNLKRIFVDNLRSTLGLSAPLITEISMIAEHCFREGVRPDKLAAFLESPDVLGFLVEMILDNRPTDPASIASQISAKIGNMSSWVRHVNKDKEQKSEKRPVDPATEARIRACIEKFASRYDPTNKAVTVFDFVQRLKAKFADYDVAEWLKIHKNLLIVIISGKSMEALSVPDTNGHLSDIVRTVYLNKGRTHPEEYIRLTVDRFVQYYPETTDSPKFLRNAIADRKRQDLVEVDVIKIAEFFESDLEQLVKPDVSLLTLRTKLIDECLDEVGRVARDCPNLVLVERGTNAIQIPEFESVIDRDNFIRDKITAYVGIASSHITPKDLLQDHTTVSPEVLRFHKQWFDEEGNLKEEEYMAFLRREFGDMLPEGASDDELLASVSKVINGVNNYFNIVTTTQGIPSIVIDEIQDIDTLADLVRLANEPNPTKKRFGADRQIALAIVRHGAQKRLKKIASQESADKTKEYLGKMLGMKPITTRMLKFKENARGKTTLLGDKAEPLKEAERKHPLELIVAEFDGMECYFLPVPKQKDFEALGTRDNLSFIRRKTEESTITKAMTESNGLEDVTDGLAMTIVVKTPEELKKVHNKVETAIGFGRIIKLENRYKEHLPEVRDIGISSKGRNKAKASNYKTLRYAVNIPCGPNNEDIPVEIRAIFLSDLLNEKSEYNPASHKNGYQKRRLQVLEAGTRAFAPEDYFPDHYISVNADADDSELYPELAKSRLKTAEDYKREQTS